MADHTAFEKVKRCFERGQRFVITTHVNPDGDGLGSESALAAFLSGKGKDVYIFNSSPVPGNYDFLDPEGKMMIYSSDRHRETILTADYFVVVDISDWKRLRELGEDIKDITIPKICIDHHPPHEKFGDIRLVNTKASSTGEIVFELIKYCGGHISKDIAEALYTCIMTDTGSFRFSNTNAYCFRIASELIECGADPHRVYQLVYERQTYAKTRLLAYVINHMQFEKDGRIAWFSIPKNILSEIGAKSTDTEGFSDYPRVINGVEVALMFNEIENGRIKVSFRSKGNYIINEVAQKLGGGGHPFAAGVLLEGTLPEIEGKVLSEVSNLLSR